MASRDFTIDTEDNLFVLIPHTEVARQWLSDRIANAEFDKGTVVHKDDLLEIADKLRKEGFRVNT